jgi:hypothetical protein
LHTRKLQNLEAPTHQCILHGMTYLITISWLKTHQIVKFNISRQDYFIMPWIQLSKAENCNSLCLCLAFHWSCCQKNCRSTTVKTKLLLSEKCVSTVMAICILYEVWMEVLILETWHPTEPNNMSHQLKNIGVEENSNLCVHVHAHGFVHVCVCMSVHMQMHMNKSEHVCIHMRNISLSVGMFLSLNFYI